MPSQPGPEVVVLRCGVCGDTFPAEDQAAATCPACGSSQVERAAEPFL